MIFALLALVTTAWAQAGPHNPYARPDNIAVKTERAVDGQALDPFHWRVVPPVLRQSDPGTVQLRLVVPQGFVIYRDQVHVKVVDDGELRVGRPQIPRGEVRLRDGYDLEARELFDADVVVTVPVRAGSHPTGLATMHVMVSHQGCHKGYCFRPVETVMQVHVPVREQKVQVSPGAVNGGEIPPRTQQRLLPRRSRMWRVLQ